MIKIHHKYCLIVLFSFLFVKGFTQSDIDISQKNEVSTKSYFPFGIKATFHHGAISSHRAEVNEIIEGHTQAYELSFYKSTPLKNKIQ